MVQTETALKVQPHASIHHYSVLDYALLTSTERLSLPGAHIYVLILTEPSVLVFCQLM